MARTDIHNHCIIVNNGLGTALSIQANYLDRLDRCEDAWVDLELFLNKAVPLPDGYSLENRVNDPVLCGPGSVIVQRDTWNSSTSITNADHRKIIWDAFKDMPAIIVG